MSWKSPLIGYENAEPLPTTFNADGKSYYNPSGPKSRAYEEFPDPIDSSNNGFDFHSKLRLPWLRVATLKTVPVYYMQTDEIQIKFARELHERIRREFPEVCAEQIYIRRSIPSISSQLRIYKLFDKPVGENTSLG